MSRENRMTSRARGDEGMAVILVLGYLAVVSLLAATFIAALNRNISRVTKAQDHQVCVNVAEGGIEQVIAAIRGGTVSEQAGELGNGQFTATVREADGAIEIVCTATLKDVPAAHARVTALVERTPSGGVRVLQWKEVAKW